MTITTSVPALTFTSSGVSIPDELDVLDGVLTDIDTAFGGGMSTALTTPQGQLAQSLTAIIGDKNDQIAAVADSLNPDVAEGRWQDAIGRLYFLERIAASGTVVTARCTGLVGTVIPAGSVAQDTNGYRYQSTADATIASTGYVDVTFQNLTTGPIACGIGALATIYTAVTGWESVTNISAGVVGTDVETRADFEARRRASVAINAQGSPDSVQGEVLSVTGVLDAYVRDNGLGIQSGAAFTGSISGTTLTVASMASGKVETGHMVIGSGVSAGTVITGQLSGTTGQAGTYSVNVSQTAGSTSMTSSVGGYPLAPHSLYVAAYGGDAQAIGEAIWRKKSPGCNYNGNTTVTVEDPSSNYSAPRPTYEVTFMVPAATAIKFAVSLQNNNQVPADAVAQVKAAIVSAFNGSDGGTRARIGSTIFASRYYAGIAALGTWAQIQLIQVGIGTADRNSIAMRIDQVPTLSNSDITVTIA